jgi:hypothetical protein
MTDAASKQLKKLEDKRLGLMSELARVNARLSKPTDLHKYLIKERNSLYGKLERCDDSIRLLNDYGMTAAEHKKVAAEVLGGNSILEKTETSLGCRERVVVGFSTKLSSYIRVRSTRWNGFMRNVKGCASMADTCDITWSTITEEEFNNVKASGIKHLTAFGGTQETERPCVEEKIIIQTEGFVQTTCQD